MTGQIFKKEHTIVPKEVLDRLPDSQSPKRGRHKCAACAYEEGFKAGIAGAPTRIETEALINYLKKNLDGYEITVKDNQVHFKSDREHFEDSHSLRVLVEMHRQREIERMFLIPNVVPH